MSLCVLLYHTSVRMRTCACAVWLALTLAGAPLPALAAADRLDRFRELAAGLSALELSGSGLSGDAIREIYALLDDEILESLGAGSVFASEGFLQEQLEAFAAAWGGSTFRLVTLRPGELAVGSFQLTSGAGGNSIRVYRRAGQRAERLAAVHRPGIPSLFPMPPAAGQEQFLAVWADPASSRGTSALRVELWRYEGGRVRMAWSTADLYGPEVETLSYSVNAHALIIRYAPRYPGWTPGCEVQTEHEDRYRYVPASGTFRLVRRRVENAWHRELHATVARFLAALRSGDARGLSALGLARERRRGLPAHLEREPICDAPARPSPRVVTISARAPGDPRPWGLRFQRTPAGWRFAGAERLAEPRGIAVLQWLPNDRDP